MTGVERSHLYKVYYTEILVLVGRGKKRRQRKTKPKRSVQFKAQNLSIIGSISPSISLTVPSTYSGVTEIWFTQ